MKCEYFFLTILIFSKSISANPTTSVAMQTESATNVINSPSKFQEIQEISHKWDDLSRHIANMMINSDEIKGATFDVAIYSITSTTVQILYDGFHETLLKYSNYKFSINSYSGMSHEADYSSNFFAILLLDEEVGNYNSYISSNLPKNFKDKSLKILLLLSDDYTSNSMLQVWNALIKLKYYNVYAIKHNSSGFFKIFRTEIIKNYESSLRIYLKQIEDTKFLMMKDVVSRNVIPNIKILYYESYPMSYLNNNVIVGADGNLIQEFSQKLQTPYKIMNENISHPLILEMKGYMETTSDINLYTGINLISRNIETISLNQMHGFCLLAPRNIPVTAYENFTFPLDNASMILALISTVLVILFWRLITNEMSLTEILFAVYELILNLGASGLERLTLRENILVYCFVFSSFILVSYYESIFLSFMLTDSTMRSAHSLEELNDSNTKFFLFYDDSIADFNNLPKVRNDLVLNYTNFSGSIVLEVPDNFDENLAYFVSCEYAEYFIHSSTNIRDDSRLFDKISLALHYKTYNVRKSYFYIEEFKKTVNNLMESGIYEFWKKMEIIKSSVEPELESERSTIEFGDMGTPIVVLLLGCLVAFVVFLIEIAVYSMRNSNKVGNLMSKIKSHVPKKKLNLDNWKKKYIYKKNIGKKSKIKEKPFAACEDYLKGKNDLIKCRESTGGGYLVIKKFKKVKKSKRTKNKIIQVQPCNDNPVDE